jgi:hypothetical protein
VKTDPTFSIETPKMLFRGTCVNAAFASLNWDFTMWDISPDGKRLLMMKESRAGTTPSFLNPWIGYSGAKGLQWTMPLNLFDIRECQRPAGEHNLSTIDKARHIIAFIISNLKR